MELVAIRGSNLPHHRGDGKYKVEVVFIGFVWVNATSNRHLLLVHLCARLNQLWDKESSGLEENTMQLMSSDENVSQLSEKLSLLVRLNEDSQVLGKSLHHVVKDDSVFVPLKDCIQE